VNKIFLSCDSIRSRIVEGEMWEVRVRAWKGLRLTCEDLSRGGDMKRWEVRGLDEVFEVGTEEEGGEMGVGKWGKMVMGGEEKNDDNGNDDEKDVIINHKITRWTLPSSIYLITDLTHMQLPMDSDY